VYQVEKALKDLVDVALKRGYVSFHQVNDYLPDEGGDPQMVDRLILVMEELELKLAEDPAAPALPDADDPASSNWSDVFLLCFPCFGRHECKNHRAEVKRERAAESLSSGVEVLPQLEQLNQSSVLRFPSLVHAVPRKREQRQSEEGL